MRPVRLTMHGFTSFAEPVEIDFSDLDLFVITGPTGSGKTSILDAMTWALYGYTARLGKCGEELISHGANSVAVHFEFVVGMDRYRVARAVRRKGASQVRFEIWQPGGWVPDDASGAREINAAIAKVVGLDFDAFKLSVVLPQGQFDQFLRGEDKERREIMKTLLGLEVYDRMREIAGRRAQDLWVKEEAEQTLIDRDYADATEENLKRLQADLDEQQGLVRENCRLAARADKLCDIAKRLEDSRAAQIEKNSEKKKLDEYYVEAREQSNKAATEVQRVERELERIQLAHDGIVIDEQHAHDLVALKTRAEQLAKLQVERAGTEKQLPSTRADLEAKRAELDGARRRAAEADQAHLEAAEVQEKAKRNADVAASGGSGDFLGKLLDDLGELPGKLNSAREVEHQKNDLLTHEKDLQAEVARLGPEREAAERALSEAKTLETELLRQDAHRELRAGLKKGEPCPVCEQPISVLPKVPARGQLKAAQKRVQECEAARDRTWKEAVEAQTELDGIPAKRKLFEVHASEIAGAIEAIRKRVRAVTEELDDAACAEALRARIEAILAAERELKASQQRAKEAAKAAQAASNLVNELEKKEIELAGRVESLRKQWQHVSAGIEAIEPEIERAGGASRIAQELAALNAARERKAQLALEAKKAQADLDAARQAKQVAALDAARREEQVRVLEQHIAGLEKSVSECEARWAVEVDAQALPPGPSESRRATAWRDELRNRRDGIQSSMAKLERDVANTKEKMARVVEMRQKVEEVRVQRGLYEQLNKSLFANKFIDHLLSRAYDHLCASGSEHLMRLSSERYSFTSVKNQFSVKDAWNGGAERPAATLSGGESFLASLALALALAESVASFGADGSHAGRLEALFLDEGVSSLDQDEALPAVVEALVSLQAGDRMIGVISHMENLAERLPARIEVVKNHGRSTLRVDGYTTEVVPAVAQRAR